MKHLPTPQVEVLRALVTQSGGPASFAKHMSADKDDPIDPTFVSQILNGHRSFGDKARRNMEKRAGLSENYFEVVASKLEQQVARYNARGQVIEEAIRLMSEMPTDRQQEALGAIRVIHSHYQQETGNPELRTGT